MSRTLCALLLAAPLAAQQQPAQARYDSAYFAWQAGNYPDALARFERLLSSADGSRFLEPIALLTGEYYRAAVIAPDGAGLRWSDDGRLAAFTTSNGRVTHVVAVDGDSVSGVARLEGTGVVFAPDGHRIAYFAIPETDEVRTARAVLDSLAKASVSNQRLNQQRAAIARLERQAARLRLRDVQSGQEREIALPPLEKSALTFAADGRSIYLVGQTRMDSARTSIYAIDDLDGVGSARPLVEGPGIKHSVIAPRAGEFLVYGVGPGSLAVRSIATGETRTFDVTAPAISADGSTLAWVNRVRDTSFVTTLALKAGAQPVVVKRSPRPIATPSPSPDGQRIAYALQLFDDWEIYVVTPDGQETRLTREIQHDRFPRWVDDNRVLAVKGEPRHSRAYVYDVRTRQSQRLHHNNTIRTVAPEYEWAISPDGGRVLVVADRDGNTISPERSVTLVDLARPITIAELQARIRQNAAAERDLRERGKAMFALMEARIRPVVRDVSVARIYEYEKAVFEFDSKHITQPGNAKAIDYYVNMLKSFGYEPEVQWFVPRQGIRTANVIARIPGTTNPELIYVVSSHFDSVAGGPGADDDSSGSAALLEAARVLAGKPQAATIELAFFTGEEGGLLGSREYVRRAVADRDTIVGALNNDMVGWANDFRLDNTIRYSNDGIRDLQHAAAFLFTDLITYDARYYRSTDAAAYYEAYGDIVGGIGSYPILGNPHYHQPHDILEHINHQLVAEVSKTTVASIMLLASSPARLTGLEATNVGGKISAKWTQAPEKGVVRYIVHYGPPGNPMLRRSTVRLPTAELTGAQSGWVVAVKAENATGLSSWDWARVTIP